MAKRFYTHIDLRNNQLLKTVLENITSGSAGTLVEGRIYYDTDLNKPVYYDGIATREFFYKDEALDPSTITQSGLDATAQEFLVTGVEKTQWNALAADTTDIERISNKDTVDGYAGLDSSGQLNLSTLWNGMVIIDPSDGTSYRTLGELLGQSYGIPQLDGTAKLDPLVLNQIGFDATTSALLVSQAEKNQWNTVSDATAVELTSRKNTADGYAGLDSTARLIGTLNTEGVILRQYKSIGMIFDGTLGTGDSLSYTFNGGSTRSFPWDGTATKGAFLLTIRNYFNATAPENTQGLATSDTTSVTVTGLNFGENWTLSWNYFNAGSGTGSTNVTTISPAWYDLSNIGGISNIGFAPLNALGIVDNQYLPDYKDIKVVADYAELIAIGPTDRYNGMRVHVINAQDDPSNVDSTGWAEYLWLDDLPGWERTTERESSIDLKHNNLLDIQGEGESLNPKQHYHLTQQQWQSVKDAEYTVKHQNINPSVGDGFALLSFDSTEVRACKINLTLEDNDGQGTQFKEMTVFYDGNYPSVLEFGDIGSPMTKSFSWLADQDINNWYLYLVSDSTDVSIHIRVKPFDMFDPGLEPPLTPEVDLLAADGLFPDYAGPGSGSGIVPGGSLAPSGTLVPSSP
jgi:hypothetical protein